MSRYCQHKRAATPPPPPPPKFHSTHSLPEGWVYVAPSAEAADGGEGTKGYYLEESTGAHHEHLPAGALEWRISHEKNRSSG
eukprot:COSAG01_NODE_2384_length_7788_cov_8.398751_12_plen_82_part_00